MPPRYLLSSEEESSDESVPLAQLVATKSIRLPADRNVLDDVSDENFVTGKDGDSGSSNEFSDEDRYNTTDSEDLPLNSLKTHARSVHENTHITTKVKHTNNKTKVKIKPMKASYATKKTSSLASKNKKKKKVEYFPTKSESSIVSLSAELYSKSVKGKLVQAVLCRWWYAYQWPSPESISSVTPTNCNALDGFPGVYVHTSGDNVGTILDYRNKSTCPNFLNFARKTSAELRDLLLTAIEKQKSVLIQVEGQASIWLNDLSTLGRWAKQLNTDKADREAVKVLTAASLSLY